MKEYGGYIELDKYRLPMLHDRAIALNCGRNCLEYLIKARKIKRIFMPYFICDSVLNLCRKNETEILFYHINDRFIPENITLENDTWLYVVNYYGQLDTGYLKELKRKYDRVIIDNAQAYFDMPIENTDTLYTCRKYFGVSDGAFLYTTSSIDEDLPVDESFERMRFLLGRFERSASEFYNDNVNNNHMFANEPVKKMSKLTDNLLHGIDYDYVKRKRSENYRIYHRALNSVNILKLNEVEGAFAYPLWIENGTDIRKDLQKKNIYIPTLWPNVVNDMSEETIEYKLSKNVLPLPCDQRYDQTDIEYIIKSINV